VWVARRWQVHLNDAGLWRDQTWQLNLEAQISGDAITRNSTGHLDLSQGIIV